MVNVWMPISIAIFPANCYNLDMNDMNLPDKTDFQAQYLNILHERDEAVEWAERSYTVGFLEGALGGGALILVFWALTLLF